MHGHGGLVKRGKCEFPTNAGLVPVTPNEKNAGWAMSPDQPCVPGMYAENFEELEDKTDMTFQIHTVPTLALRDS